MSIQLYYRTTAQLLIWGLIFQSQRELIFARDSAKDIYVISGLSVRLRLPVRVSIDGVMQADIDGVAPKTVHDIDF